MKGDRLDDTVADENDEVDVLGNNDVDMTRVK